MKPDFDLIVRQALPMGGVPADFAIRDGAWAAAGENLAGSAVEEIDATGAILMPGVIDAHVHFNEPGREHWEGLETGPRALAAGGGTVFFDMPLNSTPPVIDAEAVCVKRALAERKSCIDFAIWGGLTPDSLDEMESMAGEGVIGFKAFMCGSGIDEFIAADAVTLKRGMEIAAKLGLPVAVHAEDERVIAGHQAGHPPRRPGAMTDWLASRPHEAELASILIAIDLAGETGADLHVVHVSHPEGLRLIAEARDVGVKVTAETCPHYLLIDAEEACRIGPAAKCAPPLREAKVVRGLWAALREGKVDTVGSDHSPSSADLKAGDDLFTMWGGIGGCQHGFELLCNAAISGEAPLSAIARLTCDAPAKRFRIAATKRGLEIGGDADFFLLKNTPSVISERDLLYRHPISPYVGRHREWTVCRTWLRGRPVGEGTCGRFLKPQNL